MDATYWGHGEGKSVCLCMSNPCQVGEALTSAPFQHEKMELYKQGGVMSQVWKQRSKGQIDLNWWLMQGHSLMGITLLKTFFFPKKRLSTITKCSWKIHVQRLNSVSFGFNKAFCFHQLNRRNFLGMSRIAHQKKPEEESFAFFLPRLITEPGLTLNFSATALKNSMVMITIFKLYLNVYNFS